MINKGNFLLWVFSILCCTIGVWSASMFLSAMAMSDWSMLEVTRQFLVATGNLQEYETLVDFYTHIKGVEYLIAVSFFFIFPAYYKFISKEKVKVIN